MPGSVGTWMRDRLWAGKPSRYVTSHLGQLSLPSTNLSHRSEQSACFSTPTQDTSVYCSFRSLWLTVT